MTRTRAWLRDRIGRRGAVLLCLAVLDLMLAADMVGAAPATAGTYAFLATLAPLWVWALPWGAVGLLCGVFAFRRADRLAWIGASWLKVGWSALHLAGWLLGELPRGHIGAAIWIMCAGVVQVIATWPEPPRRR